MYRLYIQWCRCFMHSDPHPSKNSFSPTKRAVVFQSYKLHIYNIIRTLNGQSYVDTIQASVLTVFIHIHTERWVILDYIPAVEASVILRYCLSILTVSACPFSDALSIALAPYLSLIDRSSPCCCGLRVSRMA